MRDLIVLAAVVATALGLIGLVEIFGRLAAS